MEDDASGVGFAEPVRLARIIDGDGDGDASSLLLEQMSDENFPPASEDDDGAFSMVPDAIGGSSTEESDGAEYGNGRGRP
mmetsp:Transcript_22154/g.34428  ORF Transcript_22154/g.34428 Transcript_22154/m.34428 type:complete len:80 (+) Transcript_22154:1-240(+)